MSEEEFKLKLKSLLDEYGKVIHKDGAFCTSYFLTAEWFDGDGEYWRHSTYDDKAPIWHITGLVQYALEQDFIEEEDED